ncbi:hypothetical protein KAFR_0A07370 [Kazachstania africana CBS 2517]|uniref:Serine/threonine-protein kinase CBK1 n=1 Tax=Kazachstania africana (strain ATCC 22294 / BCRC 22015 / CBS 2517 / CECT 1963 / NBRC 1671 / NRRL Y-8276) TaxID=1071382 RepID=H2AP71_KAZAF|nr:hypothetical protein KAFR_0A07370 [Kazachstania africana CBS 2517]CCF56171.1 hypothetical protein KAFR_0A07370 [Kazachstania africana CBS 2517]
MFGSNPYNNSSGSGNSYQQQQQQQPYEPEMDMYQQIQRPPVAGFSNNYMRQQNSHQSLQDQLQEEGNGNVVHGGFTDLPGLNYPTTPTHQNNYIPPNLMNNAQQQQQQQQQPPAMTGIFKHNNNSNSMIQQQPHVRNDNSGASVNNFSQPAAPYPPSHYSNESDYSQHQNNMNTVMTPIQHSQNHYNQAIQQTPTRNFQASQPHQLQNMNASSNNASSNGDNNYMFFERRPDLLSKATQDRAAAVKLKVENFYQQSVKYAIERNERRVELEGELTSHNWSDERKSRQLSSLGKKESQFLRLRRTRLSLEDFQTVKVIGKGAFGEVRLVQKKDTGKIYAMKTLLKSEMYKKDQLAHVKAERDVLAGSDSPWVVSLYYSFQDAQYLYLIMEFLPGGDLMTMLIRWQLFTEDVTRFYMAECILAIETVHKLGFIHRDIKPDNILIDIRGHIKLSDFGLSTGFHKTHDSNYYKKLLQEDQANGGLTKPGQTVNNNGNNRQTMIVDSINLTMSNRQQIQTWRKSRRLMAYSTVGTPDYIAPEIFLYQGYGQECDWWSLGAIMYECLIGWPPFCSETPQETYRKIMNFEQTLQFPDDIHISYEAEDLIRRLLSHADQRLGRHGGADEIKNHPFFRGVDWNTIRQVEAPYIPKLSSITDTRFFPTDELENVPDSPAMVHAAKQREEMMKQGNVNNGAVKEDLPFIGYTYSRFDYLTRKNAL